MSLFKKLFVGLISVLLLFTLLGTSLSSSVNVAFSKPTRLENWIQQSSLYQEIINKASTLSIDSLSSTYQVNGLGDAVNQAAMSAYPESAFKKNVNTILSSNYAWLKGSASTPSFNISISAIKRSYALQIGSYVQSKINSLPICNEPQTIQLLTSSVLSVGCRPTSLTGSAISSQVTNLINSSAVFSSKTALTQNNLKIKSSESKPYYQKLSEAPKYYQLNQKMPWILGILSLIIILVLVFIDSSRRKGLRKASFVLLLSGLVLIASYLVNSSLINRVDNHIKNSHDLGSFKQASIELVSKVSSFLAKIDLWFGVAYILLALAIIVLLSSVRRQIKNDPDSDSKLDKESVSDTPKSESVASRININPRRSQHTLDIIGSTKRGNSLDPTKTASRLKSNPPKNRGRLIQ